ncbi:MAG: hypothetical protein DWI69_03050 [Chloroflexi bacterium]|nr:MAG: hypothetical protein DWI60_00115 [Chloroflexota bacterium]RLT56409.1 MAG: hypothetical protein DWI69_03050 [Chloroflexota bacterium]
MRPTLAKGLSVSDSTSWAYALLVVLLASPVLAAVVVLVTTVGQTESNRVPVQASGSGGQSVAQEVRPVIVMQRVTRGSARRPGSAADPVGKQGASPATIYERIDRFTSRRREPTRRRRGDSPAGDPDQVPYPSSSWPAVAPPLIETPGGTSPDANASGGLGREMSPVRSWSQWVRALVEITLPPRQVRPATGGRQEPVRAIVPEPPEIPARAEGGYMLPPVRVRAGLIASEGSPRPPLMVTGIAEIEAGANTSRTGGEGGTPSRLVAASTDEDAFELAWVPAVVDQASQLQLSFLVAEPDSGAGFVIAEPSPDDLTRLAPLPEVGASDESDYSEDVGSAATGSVQGVEASHVVMEVPSDLVAAVMVTGAEPLEAEVGSVWQSVAMSGPETPTEPTIAEFEDATAASGELIEMELAVEIAAQVVALEPVAIGVPETRETNAELLEVEHADGVPGAEMPVGSVKTASTLGPVAEVEPVDVGVDVDADFAGMAPETAIDPVMAETTGVSVDEAELSAAEPAYAMPYPVLAINPVDAGVMEPMAVESDLDEAEPGIAMPAPVLDRQPTMSGVGELRIAEAEPDELQPATERSEPELDVRPVVAEVAAGPVAQFAEVQQVTEIQAPEIAVEPTMSGVVEVRFAEAGAGELHPATEMSEPEMDVRPVVAEVAAISDADARVAELELESEVPAPEMAIDPTMVDLEANVELVEVELAIEIRAPELAVEPAFPEVIDAEAASAKRVYATPVELVVPKDAEGSGSGQGIGDDHRAHGLESQLVSDAWDAMTQAETVEMASPSEAGLELEPFVDVPITAHSYQVDDNGTDPLVTSEPDEGLGSSVPSAGSGAELGITGTDVSGSGHGATDDADLKLDGLELEDEELGTEDQEATFTPPPALPVEEPQPAWMPLPRSPKFRWVRVAMQATEVSVPHDVFGGP